MEVDYTQEILDFLDSLGVDEDGVLARALAVDESTETAAGTPAGEAVPVPKETNKSEESLLPKEGESPKNASKGQQGVYEGMPQDQLLGGQLVSGGIGPQQNDQGPGISPRFRAAALGPVLQEISTATEKGILSMPDAESLRAAVGLLSAIHPAPPSIDSTPSAHFFGSTEAGKSTVICSLLGVLLMVQTDSMVRKIVKAEEDEEKESPDIGTSHVRSETCEAATYPLDGDGMKLVDHMGYGSAFFLTKDYLPL